MTMKTIFLFFLCAAVQGHIGKHVYISEKMLWDSAQRYCRQHYTDLSFIDSEGEQSKFNSDVGMNLTVTWKADYTDEWIRGWIGLYRDSSNKTAWKWSGGGNATYYNWGSGQPDNYDTENHALVFLNGKWADFVDKKQMPFYCISITVVKIKMTWEGALKHCRENHSDLSSLVSETGNVMAQKEIEKDPNTERVWIGLRYLEDRWLWVNRDPMLYQAWTQGDQDHQCPLWTRCGALSRRGVWEKRDCNEELYFICY